MRARRSPAGRNDGQGDLCEALGECSHICHHGIATIPETDIHHSTSIIDETVRGQDLGYRRPIVGARAVKEPVFCAACRVLQPPRLAVQLIEPRERGVEVGLVE